MMRRLLAVCLAFVPVSAFAEDEVKSCSLPNNTSLEKLIANRNFDGFFKAGDKEIKTVVRLKGQRGNFERPGMVKPDDLACIRYMSVDEAVKLASEKNAPGLDAQNYFDTSNCSIVIAADWAAGNSRGRVLWCAPLYASGAEIKGVYWQNTNWQDGQFTDLWDGRWQ